MRKYAKAYCNRGRIKDILGDAEGAIRDCSKAIRLKTNYLDTAYYLRGLIRSYSNVGFAFKDWDKAIKLNPKFVEVYIARATYYSDMWRSNNNIIYFRSLAIKDWNTVLELMPNNAEAYYMRGNCKHATSGELKLWSIDEEGACADWQKAASLGDERGKIAISLSKYCK
ncbi:MAG: tetratricopeptide repeat protein [Bacteroidia bacterium]